LNSEPDVVFSKLKAETINESRDGNKNQTNP
jgi:hypothetical protein